jgi:hypothetical protein
LNYSNQALPVRRDVGDRGGEGDTLNVLGVFYNDLGDNQKALAGEEKMDAMAILDYFAPLKT